MRSRVTKQNTLHGVIAFTRHLIILQFSQNSTIHLLFLTPSLGFTKDVSLTLLKTYAQVCRVRHYQVSRSAHPAPPPIVAPPLWEIALLKMNPRIQRFRI